MPVEQAAGRREHRRRVQRRRAHAALACADAQPPLAPVVGDVQLTEERRVRPVVVTRLVRRVVEVVHGLLPPAVAGVALETGTGARLLDPAVAARVDDLATVVHVVAQHLRVADAGGGQVLRAGERERALGRRGVAATVVRVRHALAGRLREQVVARVVQDGVEVREHSEVVELLRAGLAVRAGRRVVEVQRLDGVAVRRQRRGVRREVARSGRVRRLVGRQAGVVLGRHHEHPLGRAGRPRRLHAVGEALLLGARDHADVDHVAGDQRTRSLRGARLHEVGRDLGPDPLVVLAAEIAEALAAPPRLAAQRQRARRCRRGRSGPAGRSRPGRGSCGWSPRAPGWRRRTRRTGSARCPGSP